MQNHPPRGSTRLWVRFWNVLSISWFKIILQIINIIEKTWIYVFKNSFESTINVSEYLVSIIIPIH